MMQIDVEMCTGCGDCLEACPNDAIALVEGKATIDIESCLTCGACEAACPEGAISEFKHPVKQEVVDIHPVKIQPIAPLKPAFPASMPERRISWIKPVLTYIGSQILPRLVDTLFAAVDRRLSATAGFKTTGTNPVINPQRGARQRQVRRRRRGKNR
jgi:NAD-dependent dihydropyrimidine dehydrogenase PreA subunit